MNTDFTFCDGNECNKRYECKRWINNYPEDYKDKKLWYMFSFECIENNYSAYIEIEKGKNEV